MKNKRKYEDSTVSTAEVAKKKLKKISKKAYSPVVAAIREKVAAFVQDHRKQANNLVDVMAYLDLSETASTCTAALHGIKRIFASCLEREAFISTNHQADCKQPAQLSPEEQYRSWLGERFEAAMRQICALTHHAKPAVGQIAVVTLMNLMQAQHRRSAAEISESWREEDGKLLHTLLLAVCSNKKASRVAISRFQEFLEYEDVRYNLLLRLGKIVKAAVTGADQKKLTPVFVDNVLSVMEKFDIGGGTKDKMISSFLCRSKESGLSSFRLDREKMKKNFATVWLNLLKCQLNLDQYKRVLVMLAEKVMPHLPRPLLLTDFLLASYAVGGSISLLALSGVFTLMTKYNLEYPDFYIKLYGLFTVEVLFVKYKARFFHLADIFLSSTHLPEYLVAAFAKRLARLTLQAPANTLEMCIRFIHNLMHRHRGLVKLIDNPGRSELIEDPYLDQEPDPAKSRAMESSLWEIKTLAQHILPQVSAAAKDLLEKGVREQEKDVSAVLETSWKELVDLELRKKVFVNVPLNFEEPTGLRQPQDDLLSELVVLL